MTERFTKGSPGSFRDLIDYLAELGGESKHKIMTLSQTRYDALPRLTNKRRSLRFPLRQCVGVTDLAYIDKAKEECLYKFCSVETRTGANRYIICTKKGKEIAVPVETVWDKIIYYHYKDWSKDFKWSKAINPAGKYQDWEGDGYYVINLYLLEGKYFAPGMITSSDGFIEPVTNEELIKYLTS